MNRYTLTSEVEAEYTPIVKEFIEKVEANNGEGDFLEKDFSDTKLNPYTLCEILEKLGYEKENQDDNGWQMDFWITMVKDGCTSLSVEGTGITFEVRLVESDYSREEHEKAEREFAERFESDFKNIMGIMKEAEEMLKGD